VYISVTIFEGRDLADTQIAEFSGQSLLNSTNVCFNSFLWSLPSILFCSSGRNGGRKQSGRQAKGSPSFGRKRTQAYASHVILFFDGGPILETMFATIVHLFYQL